MSKSGIINGSWLLSEIDNRAVVLGQKIGEPCGSPKDTVCVLESELGTDLNIAALVVWP